MGPEGGHAGVELAVAIAVLMIPSALVVLGFGPWSERAVLAEAAAAEAARVAVVELSTAEGEAAVATIGANYGLGPDELRIGWCGSAPISGGAGTCAMQRGGVVEATVEIWVPLVGTPWGTVGGVWITRHHAERIDLYRSLG